MVTLSGRVVARDITVGRDLGPVGRGVRLVLGVLGVSFGIGGLVGGEAAGAAPTLVASVGIAGYYLLAQWLLGERLFARANPWFGTTIMLTPLGVFSAPFMPDPVHHAAGLYVGAMLILTAVIGYGGCEVAALPTLLLRRRYVLYCPLNAVDAPEKSLHHLRMDAAAWAAVGVIAVVGVWFVLGREIVAGAGLRDPVASWWALVLVAPAGLLAARAWQEARRQRPAARGEAWVLGLGAVVLLAVALVFAGLLAQDLVWAAVMLGGLVVASVRATLGRLRHRKTAPETG
jgi:hypothetical protein